MPAGVIELEIRDGYRLAMRRRGDRCACAQLALVFVLASACVSGPRHYGGIETSIVRRQGMLWFAPVAIRGREYEFVVDTAASITTITPRTAALAEITAVGKTIVNGRVSARTAPIKLGVGGVDHAVVAAIVDVPAASAMSLRYDGILGLDVLSRYDTVLDLRDGVLAFLPAGSFERTRSQRFVEVPFQTARNGIILVEANYDGQRMPAILDLGAQSSIVSRAGRTGKYQEGRLQLASVELGEPNLAVQNHFAFVQNGLAQRPAILLGADVMWGRVLVIAYSTRRLYLSR
jgi:predicted aspartyl protease